MTTRIDEIRARLAAATEGPWDRRDESRARGPARVHLRGAHDPDGYTLVGVIHSHRDADLIANAPADLAYLLEQVRALGILAREVSAARDSLSAQRDEARAERDEAREGRREALGLFERRLAECDAYQAKGIRDEAEIRKLEAVVELARQFIGEVAEHDRLPINYYPRALAFIDASHA